MKFLIEVDVAVGLLHTAQYGYIAGVCHCSIFVYKYCTQYSELEKRSEGLVVEWEVVTSSEAIS